MMRVNVKLDDVAVRNRLDKLRSSLADKAALHKEMGLAVEDAVVSHLRSLPGKEFYKQAAESVRLESTAESAVVSITKRGIALRYYGGVVKPTGRTSDVTGNPIRNLALPVGENGPVGEFRGKLAFIPNKKGGDTTGYLVDAHLKPLTP